MKIRSPSDKYRTDKGSAEDSKGDIWKMKFLKKLFCKHDYNYEYLRMVNGGVEKLYRCTCKKCGKVRYNHGKFVL